MLPRLISGFCGLGISCLDRQSWVAAKLTIEKLWVIKIFTEFERKSPWHVIARKLGHGLLLEWVVLHPPLS
jgi:hypothetical protein